MSGSGDVTPGDELLSLIFFEEIFYVTRRLDGGKQGDVSVAVGFADANPSQWPREKLTLKTEPFKTDGRLSICLLTLPVNPCVFFVELMWP